MPAPVSGRTTAVTQPTTSNNADSHRVVSGDTMSRIAQRNGVTVQQMVDANKARYPGLATNAGNIQVGWTLTIPGRTNTPAPTTNTPAAPAARRARSRRRRSSCCRC